jgi:hypothetical protein
VKSLAVLNILGVTEVKVLLEAVASNGAIGSVVALITPGKVECVTLIGGKPGVGAC